MIKNEEFEEFDTLLIELHNESKTRRSFLNECSEKIKELEEILREGGYPEISVDHGDKKFFTIMWCPIELRIIYQGEDENKNQFTRPLGECKVNIRLESFPLLISLMKIAKQY